MTRHLFKLIWNRKRANALIIAEILISFIVVFIVAAASMHVLSNYRKPLGFDYRGVWNAMVDTKAEVDEKADRKAATEVFRMLRELRGMPEIEAVAATRTPPYGQSTIEGVWQIDGRDVTLIMDEVTDGYADVMKLHVVRGRWFRPDDDALGFRPVVLDANAAHALYPGVEALGQKFDVDGDVELRVVGIVASYRKDGELSAPVNMVFKRIAEQGRGSAKLAQNLMIRLRPGVTAEFEPRLVERLQALAPEYGYRIRHLEDMRSATFRSRLTAMVVGFIVAAFLIIMVTLGLTGVLWQNVTARTRELGVRRALGATGGNVHRQILAEVVIIATMALALGTVVVLQIPLMGLLSWISAEAYSSALAIALATIYGLTVLCALYPSLLAGRVTPAEALHYE